jgi:citrate synthase
MKTHGLWITAAEASQILGVTRATLYAYVSREFIRSQPRAGSSRERLYSRDDVDRMRRRAEERRDPDKATARALQWGMPILESSITLIDGERLYYRGHDAVALSQSRSVAEIASLIWTARLDTTFPASHVPQDVRRADLPFVPCAQSMLAAMAARDPLALDLRAPSVARTGWRIIELLTAAATGSWTGEQTVEQALAKAWKVPDRRVDLIRAVLILCADHELNVSSFTARCVASAGSHPYAVVIAGLAALEGTKHGGATARVDAMLVSIRRTRSIGTAIADRLRRGESLEGFGHPLYRDGDPRARALLQMLRERYPRSAELAFSTAVAATAAAVTRENPNLDFALTALTRVLKLPPGSPLTLFAIGRTIGWIGHATEQYATNQLIRPRAKYRGVLPLDN